MATARPGKLGRKDPTREYKVMLRLTKEEALLLKQCANSEARTLGAWIRLAAVKVAKSGERAA